MTYPGWAPIAPYAPPPPQPGVIPLAPLSLGDYFSALGALARRYWRPLIGLGAAAFAVVYLLGYAAFAGVALSVPTDEDGYMDLNGGTVLALAVLVVVGLLLLLLVHVFVAALCPAVFRPAVLGEPAATRQMRRVAVSRLPALTGVLFLMALPALLGLLLIGIFVLLVGEAGLLLPLVLLPALTWFWTQCSLAPSVAVVEGAGPLTAIRRSFRLVTGSWWRIFGIQLLMWVIGFAMTMAVNFVVDLISRAIPLSGSTGVDITVDVLFLLPGIALILLGTLLSQLTVALLYTDQRIRREGLADALADAAYSAR